MVAAKTKLIDVVRGYMNQFPTKVVLSQVGSFFELYDHHATQYASALGIKLAQKYQRNGPSIPMAGFPDHQLNAYLRVLVNDLNQEVVVVGQYDGAGGPNQAKDRRISKIVTRGTLTTENFIDAGYPNNIIAVYSQDWCSQFELSMIDLSENPTISSLSIDKRQLRGRITSARPREIILPEGVKLPDDIDRMLTEYPIKYVPASTTHASLSHSTMMIRQYIEEHHVAVPFDLQTVTHREPTMILDSAAVRGLDLFSTYTNASIRGSLMNTINRTKTVQGSRLLLTWLSAPSLDAQEISNRHDIVEYYYHRRIECKDTVGHLAEIADIPRVLQKIRYRKSDSSTAYKESELDSYRQVAYGIAKARDILEVKSGKKNPPKALLSLQARIKEGTTNLWALRKDIYEAISTINHEGPQSELAQNLSDIKKEKARLKAYFRELNNGTGLKTIASYSAQYGYHVKVDGTNLQDNKVPGIEFIRQRTLILKNTEWQEFGAKELRIQRQIENVRQGLLKELDEKISSKASIISQLAEDLTYFDVLTAFADLSWDRQLVRPIPATEASQGLKVKAIRHLAVESATGGSFIPNHCQLEKPTPAVVITGPNMGGKSTYLRSVATLCILNQIGCFVPAESAVLPIIDQIFCRLGAGDNILESTFMVEMLETSVILREATPKSLAILDEIGRGTSAKEGVSIAAASLAYLVKNVQCFSLFATHYGPEIQHVLKDYPISYFHSSLCDSEIDYHLKPGVCSNSQAFEIAKMSGIDDTVINLAKEYSS